jgi:hypothetical protein
MWGVAWGCATRPSGVRRDAGPIFRRSACSGDLDRQPLER